jgi:hypothetical protein
MIKEKAFLASIIKIDSGDEHKFCTTLMEKTVNRIEILNCDLKFRPFFFGSVCSFSKVADFFLSATGFSYFSEFWNWIDMLVITGISE